MPRWTALFGSLMLVLMLWTGTVVHAAERLECIEVGSETAEYHEGERDGSPLGSKKSMPQHHSSCGGNQVTAPAELPSPRLAPPVNSYHCCDSDEGMFGRGPEHPLRPPIA